jgi:hypothetical protein
MNTHTITAHLYGGVGNQMFEIAHAYALAKKFNCNLKFLRNQFKGAITGSHPNKYYDTLYKKLDFVNDLPNQIVVRETKSTFYPISEEIQTILTLNTDSKTIFLEGFFQSELYFKDYSKEIKALFTPEEGIIEFLDKHTHFFTQFPELKLPHDYAILCIRRGDYIKYAYGHNPCGMDYFTKAMNILKKERYYIITDDFEWAKRKFTGDSFRFLDNISDDLHHLLSIALFKNYIISNSSFHWWGSFLSIYDSPVIIAPDKWIHGKDAKREQYWSIYRDSMTVVERDIEID